MFRIKYSREIILKILYQIDVLAERDKSQIPVILENNLRFTKGLTREEEEFIAKIVNYVQDNRPVIDEQISKHLIGWKLERLAPIDRSLLRMGIAEASCQAGKKPIIIDDIIRVAKKYSDQESYKIINAILDKILL